MNKPTTLKGELFSYLALGAISLVVYLLNSIA